MDKSVQTQSAASGRPLLRTLIVDDSSTNLRILDRTLRFHFSDLIASDSIRQASGGLEALDIMAKDKFDLVLLDIDMPDISGVEVCKRRRLDHLDLHTVIIACTTSILPESQLRYAAADMDGCVAKPINLKELRTTIERARDRRIQHEETVEVSTTAQAVDALAKGLAEFRFHFPKGTRSKKSGSSTDADASTKADLMWMDLSNLSDLASPMSNPSDTSSSTSEPSSRAEDGATCYFTTRRVRRPSYAVTLHSSDQGLFTPFTNPSSISSPSYSGSEAAEDERRLRQLSIGTTVTDASDSDLLGEVRCTGRACRGLVFLEDAPHIHGVEDKFGCSRKADAHSQAHSHSHSHSQTPCHQQLSKSVDADDTNLYSSASPRTRQQSTNSDSTICPRGSSATSF
ncbi:hypothetical protein PYCC9005_000636 [Savitreella phatthalungensis]